MRRLDLVERVLAVVLTLVVIILLFVRATHAGALWRDECATLQLSQFSIPGIMRNFQRESFPPLVPLALRAYTWIFGTSDAALRWLGFAVGLLLVAAVWFNAMRLRLGSPLFGLSLLGLSTTFLIWATSIRGYGIGSAIALIALGLFSNAILSGSRRDIALAAGACVLAGQLLLYNSVLIAAMTCAAMLVAISWREWRPAAVALIASLVSAACVLPWVLQFRQEAQSTVVFGGPITVPWLISQFGIALGQPPIWAVILWTISFVAVVVGAGTWIVRHRRQHTMEHRKIVVFATTTIVLSVLLYFAFLKVVSYRTREWYYLVLITIIAGALDLAAGVLGRYSFFRMVRLGIAVVALCVFPVMDWPKLIERQTNMDTIASKLGEDAGSRDLIVCDPWYLGIGYNWYRRAGAEWVTCPILADCTVHRFDLLKDRMMSVHAIDDLLQLITRHLQANARIWIIGDVIFVRPGETPEVLAPAPNSEFGWSSDAYADSWAQQVGVFLQKHASTGGYVSLAAAGPVSDLENARLLWAEGWRE